MPTPNRRHAHSPRPDEPDVHLRFTFADKQFDFLACTTAATNLLRGWHRSHHPRVTITVVENPQAAPLSRLPCETLWLAT